MVENLIHQPFGNVLLVWDRIGDYHSARFLALEKIVGHGKIFISDLGGADSLYKWNNPLSGHENYIPLSEKSVEKRAFWQRLFNFVSLIKKKNIKIVGLAGYGRTEYLAFLVVSKFLGVNVVLFAESWYGENKLVNKIKSVFLKSFCDGFLVSGNRAKSHFENNLQIDSGKIEIGYSVVDNQHFKNQMDVEKENILLCVARFSPEKNLKKLISAFKNSQLSQSWKLQIVGGGPLKNELEKEIGGRTNIILSDWLSYQALPLLYAHARFFILPSSFEPWGLVVNEAMAAGLPVALSDQCGCADDFAEPGSPFLFDASDEKSIAIVLNKISKLSPLEIKELGKKSQLKVENFSPQLWAKNFLNLAFG